MAVDEINKTGQEGLPEEEFSRLMGSISAMAPLVRGFLGTDREGPHEADGTFKGQGRGDCRRREALLLALKPYLSPARCAAVDYFIRLARVGDAIRSLQ
ncbi:MAG: hypothetical protein IJY22_05535 [Clostridia bacterium]|nr:hypothetical protein [Clostridia bacterium]